MFVSSGLDPAGPLFEGYEPTVRLDKSDAAYVDVIHSNGESLIVGGFGTWEPIGHVDFYPNGGRAQRGCQHLLIGGLYDFFVIVVTPCVGLLFGDRLIYHLLGQLFMTNRSKNGEPDSDESNNSDPEAKKKRWKRWIRKSKPYHADCRT